MRKSFIFLIVLFSFSISKAQIFATTSAGKQVILYQDGTWKYQGSATAGETEKPCLKNGTGNLTIKNNSESDIYFYYDGLYLGKSYVKVKAGTSKSVTNIRCNGFNGQSIVYKWNAALELDGYNMPVSDMKGIGKGSFTLTPCETEEIEVDN